MTSFFIPATVPRAKQKLYQQRLETVSHNTGRLMLFAGDQKLEHLNDDFVGKGLSTEVANPEHYFKIAKTAHISCFAAHLGLVSRYYQSYPSIPLLIKLNGKTNLIPTDQADPYSAPLYSVADVATFAEENDAQVVGVGMTVYLGSEHEAEMLAAAAQMIIEAHSHGLLTVLWMYPRGRAVIDEKDIHLLAGAAGVAATLGADFVKIPYPECDGDTSQHIANQYQEVTAAAGRTGVICVGGSRKDPATFLQTVQEQITIAGAAGVAVGRNIYQHPLEQAIRMADALTALTLYGASQPEALAIYNGTTQLH